MNIKKMSRLNLFSSRITFRLWLIMMILVVFSVAFMWGIQIFLLERNYINSTAAEIQNELEPGIRKIEEDSGSIDESQLVSLSRLTNGKMLVLEDDGDLLYLYSAGHKLGEDSLKSIEPLLDYFLNSSGFEMLKEGSAFEKVLRYEAETIALEIGIPITHADRKAYIVLYETLDQLQTVLDMNRIQLIRLSIILTVISAVIAALLSTYFVKPIRILKKTVDRLAKGELDATPGLKLKDELGDLSDSVEELSKALQRVDLLRKEVIANVSHELQSPLALISGYAEMVRDISWRFEDARNGDLNLIVKEAGRMSEMVSDILDYSQLQAGYIKLKRDWYNLCEIVEAERDHCAPAAAEFGITIRIESPAENIPFFADPVKMCQVMRNLLNNAINHTKDDQDIIIRILEDENLIRVSVINSGDPIPVEDREIIWEKYQRSQHQGRRKRGTGIGLSIVSTFLNAHGMAYGVECSEGMTEFWFEWNKEKDSL